MKAVAEFFREAHWGGPSRTLDIIRDMKFYPRTMSSGLLCILQQGDPWGMVLATLGVRRVAGRFRRRIH